MKKLVRDKIPEIAQTNGKPGKFRTLSDAEYRQALYLKLIEESMETNDASELPLNEPLRRRERITAELADLLEVVEAIMRHEAIDSEALVAAKEQKFNERGGFERRVLLDDDG